MLQLTNPKVIDAGTTQGQKIELGEEAKPLAMPQPEIPALAWPSKIPWIIDRGRVVELLADPEALGVVVGGPGRFSADELALIQSYFEAQVIKFEFISSAADRLLQLQAALSLKFEALGFGLKDPRLAQALIEDLLDLARVIDLRHPDDELRFIFETDFYRGNDFHSDDCDVAIKTYYGPGTIVSNSYEAPHESYVRRVRDNDFIFERVDQCQLPANVEAYIKAGLSHRPPDRGAKRLTAAASHRPR